MNFLCSFLRVSCLVIGMAIMSSAYGQGYPNRTVRIVTANPGGGNDLAARIIYQPLSAALGQSVIVENRGGGNGENTVRALLSQPADGYTLLVYSTGLWLAHLLNKVSWDPVRDFAPITWMATAPNVLVVHPSLPVKSVKDLISLAKRHPGDLNYSSGQNGAGTHMAAELLKSMAKINIVRVIYKGTGAGIVATVSGETQVMFPSVGSVASFLNDNKLRPLAVSSAKPSVLLPNLPTMAAAGLPGYESEASYGAFAAAGTPDAVVKRLNREIVKILGNPDIKARFFKSGIEIVASSPEEFSEKIKIDIGKWGKVIENAGIRVR